MPQPRTPHSTRGARAITHVHNAHRRWRARDPGLAGVALVRSDATVQAIVDGVHLAPESAFGAFLAARRRFCLVTDAVEAAGWGRATTGWRAQGPGGGRGGAAGGRHAGGKPAHDGQAVRNLIEAGAGLGAAVHAAAAAPAGLLARNDLGSCGPARRRTSRSSTTSCAWCARWSAASRRSAHRRDRAQPGRLGGPGTARRPCWPCWRFLC